MLRERLMVAALAALITLLALVPLGLLIGRRLPPAVAMVDLQLLVEEEQQRAAAASAGQLTAEQRLQADKKAAQFARRLSSVVDGLGSECRCVLINKAALLGGVAVDYTDVVRSRIGSAP